jgi:NAD(P)-dependent dehydrogenase (short-subunit alcohol dehydrogenase family)
MKKHVFITGINGQLGSSLTTGFLDNDWIVYGMDLNKSEANNSQHFCNGSVTDRNSFKGFFGLAENTIEDNDCVCLINNAGVSIFSDSENRSIEEFHYVTEVNMLGPIFGMTELKIFADVLNKSFEHLRFSVINIGSIYGILSPDNSIYTDTARNNSEIYGATKAGLAQMTKYFATRYAEIPISINCIAPGGILNKELQGDDFIKNYSRRVPLKRMCNDSELTELCVRVAEPGCSYLTGQVIALDGGLSAW